MSWHGPRRGRRGYHHGNLREALVSAALDLIREYGPAGFSFAEAARRAGVSPAAPYRHFRDRDALLNEVARQGFERFADVLEKGWNGGRPSVLPAFEEMGRAYLSFARDEPAYYAAMFESGIRPASDPNLQREADRAFAVLKDAAMRLNEILPPERRAPLQMMTLHVWAIAHGVASLFGAGRARPTPISPEDLLESAMLIYLQGLGLGRDAQKSAPAP
jgi:AcrR family transcriptional regulator